MGSLPWNLPTMPKVWEYPPPPDCHSLDPSRYLSPASNIPTLRPGCIGIGLTFNNALAVV